MSKPLKRGLAAGAALVLALIVFITLWGAAYQENLEIPAGRSGRYVAVAGNQIRYLQKGIGPDILLIHGCPGSIEDWEPVIDRLAQDYRVTAYDRPGHGFSGSRGDQYTYDYHAGVAVGLIEALRLRDVVVVGHSYGGGTALALALREPAQLKSVVILDSGVYALPERPDGLYRVLSIPGFGTGVARLIGPWIAPQKIRAGILAQFPAAAPPDGFVETRIEIWNQPKVTTSIARESLKANAEMFAMSQRYNTIKYPTFIAVQAASPTRRQSAEKLHRAVRGSELLLLSDTGHYVQLQKTDEVIGLIRKAAAASAGRAD